MNRIVFIIAVVMAAMVARAQPLTVAAAVSMKDALQQIAADREAQGGGKINFVFGSSGQLQQQILNGAPVDIYISAAAGQMDALAKADAIDPATRRDIASNRLVLIAPAGSTLTADSLASLDTGSISKLAIGEPRTVPAGQYASEALRRAGIESQLADRIITAANVRQVLSYVERGEVTAGIVYASDARASGTKVKVVLEIDADLHAPIVYPAAVVANSKHAAAAGALLDDLLKAPMQKRLAEFGFAAPEANAK